MEKMFISILLSFMPNVAHAILEGIKTYQKNQTIRKWRIVLPTGTRAIEPEQTLEDEILILAKRQAQSANNGKFFKSFEIDKEKKEVRFSDDEAKKC